MNINEYAANSRVDRILAIIQALRENIPMTPGGFLKDYTDELHNEAAELREIVNKETPTVRVEACKMPEKLFSAREAIARMRDEFVILVLSYNGMGLFGHAMEAQKIAVALHEFLCHNGLDAIRWPAELITRDLWANCLMAVDGSELETGDIT